MLTIGRAITLAICAFLLALSFLCIVYGVLTPDWSNQKIHLNDPGVHDPSFGRGLWAAYVYNGAGYTTYTSYYVDDNFGYRMDPFCGSSSATSWYNLNGDTTLGPRTATLFPTTRYNDDSSWCNIKKATSAFALATVLAVILAILTLPLMIISRCPCILVFMFVMLTVFFGIIASALYGGWMRAESSDIDHTPNAAGAYLGGINMGMSFIVFVIGWGLALITALILPLSCCCANRPIYEGTVVKEVDPVPVPVPVEPLDPADPMGPGSTAVVTDPTDPTYRDSHVVAVDPTDPYFAPVAPATTTTTGPVAGPYTPTAAATANYPSTATYPSAATYPSLMTPPPTIQPSAPYTAEYGAPANEGIVRPIPVYTGANPSSDASYGNVPVTSNVKQNFI